MGKTKRGEGTKIAAITDKRGYPCAVTIASASVHEVRVAPQVLAAPFARQVPRVVIGDKAYDSDALDRQLARRGVELVAPHKRGRQRPATQDGRTLRRYGRCWKVERLFAWLQNFRRLVVRYEYHAFNFLGFVHLGCTLILLRQYL